ncbi:hypothetical protein KAW50_06115 [candidate division WOR-3 bacterium]|nr:hypothetical protein [candidate division WOR-3 bacterium]
MNNPLKRFNKLFEIKESPEKEQIHFVQRINQTIFNYIQDEYKKLFRDDLRTKYEEIFRDICYYLGENADDRISKFNQVSNRGCPHLRSLTNDDFLQTLKVLVLLYDYFWEDKLKDKNQRRQISIEIELAFSSATMDLGVTWKDGMFHPSGAKILDEKLIEDPFDWLDEFPDEKKDFKNALSHYTKKSYGDVISNCYLVVEGLVRKILNNKKTLDNNKEELFGKLEVSQSWKSLLLNYINYANEFKRHASNDRHSINTQEVEAFLYLTGLLVRLIIQNKREN